MGDGHNRGHSDTDTHVVCLSGDQVRRISLIIVRNLELCLDNKYDIIINLDTSSKKELKNVCMGEF